MSSYVYPESTSLCWRSTVPSIPRHFDEKAQVTILRRYLDEYYQEEEPLCWYTDAPLPVDDKLPLKWRDVVVEWNCKLKLFEEMEDYNDPKDPQSYNKFADTYVQLKIQRGIRDHEYILSIETYIHAIEFSRKDIIVSSEEIDQVLELFVFSGTVFDVNCHYIIKA